MNSPLYLAKKYTPFYKRNLRLAFPIILTQLGQVTVSFFDTFMVGLLGTTALASVAFANSIFMMIFILGLGFSIGQTPHIGKAFGKHQAWKISTFFQNAFLINIILGVIILVGVLLARPLLYYLDQPVEVVDTALPYFNWLMYSLIPVFLFFTCRQFADGVGNTKVTMWITLAGNVINIVLNYLLIFGKMGFPEMGIVGAGIATAIARTFMGVAYIIAIFYHHSFRPYVLNFRWSNFRKNALYQLFKTGFPISIQLIVEVMSFSATAIMVGWINTESLAAHQVVLQMVSATFMTALGVASATTIRISHLYGAAHYKATKFASNASTHIILAFMTLTAVSFIVFRYQIPRIFSEDPAVIAIAADLFIIAALFQIFDGTQAVGLAILRGLQDVTYSMYIAFLSYAVVSLPAAYLLGFPCGLGSIGVWIGLAAGLPIASIIYRLRFLYLIKRINKPLLST